MQRAQAGDRVAVNYRVTRIDGEVVDASPEGGPLELVLGANRHLPGVETAVLGMAPGESRELVLPPEEAFGVFDPELVGEIPAEHFHGEKIPETGQRFVMETADGQRSLLTVVAVDGDLVVDANHPLVGEALRVELSLSAILGPGGEPETAVTA